MSPRAHWWAGVGVLVSGTLSGIFVVTANAWMNHPTGFELADGVVRTVDPVAAMLNPGALPQAMHMTIAAFQAVGFAVAGIHATMLLRNEAPDFHRRALGIALTVGGLAAMVQPISGDISARLVAERQPAKLAAMEAQWETESAAPLRIGGWPDSTREETRFSIDIPYALSLLATGDAHGVVIGLSDIPVDERPPVLVVHLGFQTMVACGIWMMAVAAWAAWLRWRRPESLRSRGFLRLLQITGPLGFVAVQAGWTVTEVGRQPWTVYGILRTAEAVTPVEGLWLPFTTFSILYLVLAVVVFVLLRRQVFDVSESDLEEVR